jgi:hypothetical protein
MERQYYTYDLETFPNIFTFCGKFTNSTDVQLYEISDRVNQKTELFNFLGYLKNLNIEMVGYNNVGFDYNILHDFLVNSHPFTFQRASEIANRIIKSQSYGARVKNIGVYNRIIPQIDIMKVCHFDNKMKATSLKALQFAMRSDSLQDLPYDIRSLNDQEKDHLREYNVHDVIETEKFFLYNKHHIDLRREYVDDGILKGDVLNYSDVKIGTSYLINRIGKDKCYAGGKPRQSIRTVVELKDIILPKIYFRTEIFEKVLTWFKRQVVYFGSSEKPAIEHSLSGLRFHFGIGGVHASAENKIFYTDETHQIIDIDVAAMYPSVAIANGFGPEHLGESFTMAYAQVKKDRGQYAKGTSRNKALKLAGNGAYGNFNNTYSPLYDPKTMLQITCNGQLQILQLVEMMDLLPDCELIQGNTDGITIRINKEYIWLFEIWCKEWENMTGLELERVDYSRMWIRDVNNYMAETMDGKLKRKGAYQYPTCIEDYDGFWNKDYSNLASKKAVEKVHTESWPVEVAIRLITDPFDFMLRYKTPGGSKLFIGDEQQQKTCRYYVSIAGQPMKKISPPKGEEGQYKRKNKLKDEYFNEVMKEIGKDVWDARVHTGNKSKYTTRETSIQSGRKVKQCNVASDFDWNDVDWDYYTEETKKLIIGSN